MGVAHSYLWYPEYGLFEATKMGIKARFVVGTSNLNNTETAAYKI